MTNLQQKIKELEAKHKEQLKAEKAKLMAKYRAADKKKQEFELKKIFADFLKYRKFFNDDILLLGCLEHGIKTMSKTDEASKQKLDYFRGLIQQTK